MSPASRQGTVMNVGPSSSRSNHMGLRSRAIGGDLGTPAESQTGDHDPGTLENNVCVCVGLLLLMLQIGRVLASTV